MSAERGRPIASSKCSTPNGGGQLRRASWNDIDHQIIAAFRKANPATRQRALNLLRQAMAEKEASRS